MAVTEQTEGRVLATLDAKDFGGHWVSAASVHTLAALRWDALDLEVTVQNTGQDLLPAGIGWHPYFALPSGKRDQARLRLPARGRALVNNYDDEFPTGRIEPVFGTPYDFTGPDGAPLGSTYFDDCFLDLEKSNEGQTRIEISDPAAHYGIRLIVRSPRIQAIQVYSPPGSAFVVVEPQFNLADPFSPAWPADVNTGMVVLPPGHSVTWAVRWELMAI